MLLAPRWPPATGLASYLSGCFFLVVGRRPSRVRLPNPKPGFTKRLNPPVQPPDSAYPLINPFRFPPASGGTLEPRAFSHPHTQTDLGHLTFLTAATSALFLERLCSPKRPKLPPRRDWISARFL